MTAPSLPIALAVAGLYAAAWSLAGVAVGHAAVPSRAGAAAADTVLVARRDLARGAVLTAADIDTVLAPVSAPAAPRGTAGARVAPGWTTRRVIRAGEPLRAPAVVPPPLIPAGTPVLVVWDHGVLRLSRPGTAIGSAQLGERVLVRVDATRRFAGVATAPGVVTIARP